MWDEGRLREDPGRLFACKTTIKLKSLKQRLEENLLKYLKAGFLISYVFFYKNN